MNYQIVDNFFSRPYFAKLQDLFLSNASSIPWYYVNQINYNHTQEDTNCMFQHLVFEHRPLSPVYEMFEPVWKQFEIKSLMRIKCNCYPSSQSLIKHPMHQDYPFEHKAAIIYINNNDGFTILEDGTQIESKENRVLFFDGSTMHSSTNCTNTKARFNINLNYF